jgi:ankyrin repeat protein
MSGMNALLYAVNFKNYEMVSTLVKAGVDINFKDNKNKSALDYAIIMNDDLLIELLKNKNNKKYTRCHQGVLYIFYFSI